MSAPVTVTATRHEGWWSVRADVADAVVWTQTKRLDHVEDMAREAIALTLDIPTDDVDVEIEFDVAPEIVNMVEAARHMSEVAAHTQQIATRMNYSVAARLRSTGFSVRDIGMLMGLSAQRVSQLLAGERRVTGTSRRAPSGRRSAPDSPAELIAEFMAVVDPLRKALARAKRGLA